MNALEVLKLGLLEDAPNGDLTCQSLNLPKQFVSSKIIAKQDLVLSGALFLKSIQDLDLDLEVEVFFKDSQAILKGQTVALIMGPWESVILVERVLLNLIGRLSGIATLTSKYVSLIKHTQCKILDTRKTTPLYRTFEKSAVVHGGGINHRMNLSDEIMLKENHIIRCEKNIVQTLIQIRKQNPKVKITVECQNLNQVKNLIAAPIDQILLDNMSVENLKECIQVIPKSIKSEASGNMTLERVSRVAETGVDFISVGAITHSAPVADFSLLIS